MCLILLILNMSNGLTSKYETYRTPKYYFSKAIQFLLAYGEMARMRKWRGWFMCFV